MHRHLKTLVPLAVLLGLCMPARAAFTLSFDEATIAPGGTATIDVMVTGNGEMALYNFDFRIVQDSGSPGSLQFASTQILNYRTAANNYVFGGFGQDDLSTVATSGGGVIGSSTDPPFGAYQRYFGSDSYLDANDPSAVAHINGTMLLARLQFTANPVIGSGSPPTEGSVFKVYYVHTQGSDDYADGISGNFVLANEGTITVQAVPEPAAIVSVLSGLVVVLTGQGWLRHRNRRLRPAEARS